jgi:hypothetical protein
MESQQPAYKLFGSKTVQQVIRECKEQPKSFNVCGVKGTESTLVSQYLARHGSRSWKKK